MEIILELEAKQMAALAAFISDAKKSRNPHSDRPLDSEWHVVSCKSMDTIHRHRVKLSFSESGAEKTGRKPIESLDHLFRVVGLFQADD